MSGSTVPDRTGWQEVPAGTGTLGLRRFPVGFALSALGLLIGLAAAVPFGDFRVAFHARWFFAAMAGAGICFVFAARGYQAVPSAWKVPLLVSIAVLTRMLLLPMYPGDDFWRYLWEGRIQHAGFNPYLISPDAPALAGFRDLHWVEINHPESAAIYPPLVEMLFAAVTRITDSATVFKMIFAGADLLTVWLLSLVVGRVKGVDTAAWFAWNPALAYASAGAAHFDSLMVCALTGAAYALVQTETAGENRRRWAWASAALLGVAIALKLMPLLLVPLWMWTLRRHLAAFIATLSVIVLPTLPFGGIFTSIGPLRQFADVARFNDLAWWALEGVTMPNPYQRNWPFTLALLLACTWATWKWRDDWRRGTFWILALVLLLSPVAHPWYFTWILPFACWRGKHVWTILSITVLAGLLLWETTSLWTAWQPNLLIRSMVLVPPALWLLFERRHHPNFP